MGENTKESREMKTLLFFNPIIKKLLEEDDYRALFEKFELLGIDVRDSTPGITRVREEYKKLINETQQLPVIDSRCPYVVDMVREEFPNLENLLAKIDPILITSAEIEREKLGGDVELNVVAPCKGFERYTDPEKKRYVCTWQMFKELANFYPPQKTPGSSPVPLGFFDELGVKVYSASGEENCRKLLAKYPKDAQLLELLFCEEGCHKGDGL